MRFRTRVLVCGYEPEQGQGQPGFEAERWWVHAATFSAQGPYSLPWWPVPEDTVKGDLFILRLAAFQVPEDVRSALTERKFEIGSGVVGDLAQQAIANSGFPLFGGGSGDRFVELPDHPEFDPSRATLGEGILGLAVAHSDAKPMKEVDGLFEALVGTFVPFPDVVGPQEVRGQFGPAIDDLQTPMQSRSDEQIEVDPTAFEAFKEFIRERFPGDPDLSDALLRLEEVASRLGQPNSYYPTGLGPVPRWSFGYRSGSSGSANDPDSGEHFGSFLVDDDSKISRPARSVSRDPAHAQPTDDPEQDGGTHVIDLLSQMVDFLTHELVQWAEAPREKGDRPQELEKVLTVDGSGRYALELTTTEAEESSVTDRLLQLLKIQVDLVPAPSVGLLAHGQEVYLSTMVTPAVGAQNEGKIFSAGIPAPGEEFEPFEEFDLGDRLADQRADGPYGPEAMEIARHAARDLLSKIMAWADGPRGEGELPFETIMYDGGAVWKHDELPPTKLKRPSLEDRLGEIFEALIELAPSPAVASFVHRKKLYLMLAACTEPGNMILNLSRLEIPPPGQPLGELEEVNISKFDLNP